MDFSSNEKIMFFDEIAALYYDRNFGSTTKSDLETLLFSEYVEHCLKAGKAIDDYTLSKELGITQSRIRSLKVRKELKYPHEGFEWKNSFAESVRNAKYDNNDHYVKFIIQDVNVLNEVRHYIEERGWYDECSLNSKLLRIPLDCFVDICIDDDSMADLFSRETEKQIKRIAKEDSSVNDFAHNFTKDGLKSFLMSAGKETILSVLSCIPFGGIAKTAFDFLGRAIKGA